MNKKDIELFIKNHYSKEKSSTFVEYLYELMEKRKIKNPSTLYNKANITRQLYSSIISGKSHPSLNVCIKFAFALKLNNHECKYLLKKAGYTLPSSSKFGLIIRYFIENEIYDLYEVNNALEAFGLIDNFI